MNDLKKLFEGLGFENVETYIQSGNVVFVHNKQEDNHLISKNIELAIQDKYQFQVPVLVRSKVEWENTISQNPFVNRPRIDHEKLHVTFLEELPQEKQLDLIAQFQYSPDEYLIVGKDVFLYCPVDYGHTKLSNNFFESKLKVKATTRNWKTTLKLLGMLS